MFDGFNRNDASCASHVGGKKVMSLVFAEILTSGMYLAIANSLESKFFRNSLLQSRGSQRGCM